MNHIELIREKMAIEDIDFYIIGSKDSHGSEYTADCDKAREWATGFTGSNGTVVISLAEAKLWTDGRYYIQCANEIKNTPIDMMTMGEPDSIRISDYLADKLEEYDRSVVIGFNGMLFSKKEIDLIMLACGKDRVILRSIDLINDIWEDRPERIVNCISLHGIEYAGMSHMEKLALVREKMEEESCSQLFISSLDDIMWLFNIRGTDVECNPVAFSYAFITMTEAFLFVNLKALTEITRIGLNNERVITCDYNDVLSFMEEYPYFGKTMLDDSSVNYDIYNVICKGYGDELQVESIVHSSSVVSALKAIKNETELENMRKFFLDDSVSMTKYIYWLKKKVEKGEEFSEVEAAKKCDEIRLSNDGCFEVSFPTIAAYGSNAAMMHYEATEDKTSVCKNRGMLLTDCGGQYLGATTDVTRTVALGEVSNDEIHSYTLVLKGWLKLMNAVWMHGCTGRNLDILARGDLWREGIDYKCGTGHGVGYCLNVHEGPQSIRYRYIKGNDETILEPGMTVTNEPGVYVEGRYGIRTENTLVVKERQITGDGRFLEFENLTWVPIDPELVDFALLDKSEKELLNNYNKEVLARLEGRLTQEEYNWLKTQCYTDYA